MADDGIEPGNGGWSRAGDLLDRNGARALNRLSLTTRDAAFDRLSQPIGELVEDGAGLQPGLVSRTDTPEADMEHPLLQRARCSKVSDSDPAPGAARYDFRRGAWVDSRTNEILVRDPCKRPKVATKKNDVETGEDQKGY